jgi:Ohr subfamily peroxiredoxin
MTTPLDKVIYTARAHVTGGRDGEARTDDGLLAVKLTAPKALGGPGTGTNPEQLFAAGYAACFLSALKFVAGQDKVAVPADAAIDATVDLGPTVHGFGIAVRLAVTLPGLDRQLAGDLLAKAHAVCPYSNATRGNVAVDIALQ